MRNKLSCRLSKLAQIVLLAFVVSSMRLAYADGDDSLSVDPMAKVKTAGDGAVHFDNATTRFASPPTIDPLPFDTKAQETTLSETGITSKSESQTINPPVSGYNNPYQIPPVNGYDDPIQLFPAGAAPGYLNDSIVTNCPPAEFYDADGTYTRDQRRLMIGHCLLALLFGGVGGWIAVCVGDK